MFARALPQIVILSCCALLIATDYFGPQEEGQPELIQSLARKDGTAVICMSIGR